MLYDPIMSSLYPHMVKEKDYRLVKKILVLFMPLVLLGVVVCYFAAPLGITIVGGAEYFDAVPVFRLLLPMLVFSFPAQLLGFPVLAPIQKEKWASFSNIAAGLFHVAGLLLLILTGFFTLINIVILRSCTNVVLFISRVSIFGITSSKNKELSSYND
jgi:PST family polysaccharide transporter